MLAWADKWKNRDLVLIGVGLALCTAVLMAVRIFCKRIVWRMLGAHWGGLTEMLLMVLSAVALYPALVARVQRRRPDGAKKA